MKNLNEIGLRKVTHQDIELWKQELNPNIQAEEFEFILKKIDDDEKLERLYTFWFLDNDKEVGFVQLFGVMKHPFQSGYIEISIFEKYRKQGLGKKAISALEAFSFDNLELKKIVAPILPDNKASMALFTSLGYEKTHTDPYAFFLQGEHVSHEIFVKLAK